MIVGKRFRQLGRYRTIVTAFARNGLGYVSEEMGLTDRIPFFRKTREGEERIHGLGQRIRRMLEDLGPTFVKLGQLASARADLLPPDILAELTMLQDHVHPFPYEAAVATIEQELGQPLDRLFAEFSREPLAAASIGQVYKARLMDGTDVAVKVQRPNIERQIETDLEILADWARLAEYRLEWARLYRICEVVEQLAKALRSELDYGAEARNVTKIAEQSKALPYVQVPEIYGALCSRRVITMSYLEGIKLTDAAGLRRAGLDRRALAERVSETIFHQVLVEGFFHADPHPGNVLALADGRLAMLDFGLMGRLSPAMKKHFVSLVIALRNQSTKGIIRVISRMGAIPEETDRDKLNADVDEMREKYYKVPLQQISLGEAVNDLFTLAFRHQIRIPTELTLLGKSLLTMEGVVTALDPSFSVFDVAEPLGRKLFLESLDPRKVLRDWAEDIPEYVELIGEVPASLNQLAKTLRRGRLRIEVASPQLDAVMKKMDRISNRLAFSIVILALSIVMVGLIIGGALGETRTLLWGIPLIDIGFIASLLMFMWLIFAIIRSGRF